MKQFPVKCCVFFLYYISICNQLVAQSFNTPLKDTLRTPSYFAGVITATNNGISLLPNFSLNKPAALFDLSAGKGRISFDPMFRFSMEGKPWTMIFWWRYKLFTKPKFTMSVGAHPSFIFRDVTVGSNGTTQNYLTTQRYFAWEATPTYFMNKHIGLGLHYLGSHGLTKDIIQYSTFLALRTIFSNIEISDQYRFTFIPQVYYLKMDKVDGKYVTASLAISKKGFPVTISSIVSQAIVTEISGKKFVWNVALNYVFNSQYNRAK